MSKRHSYSKSRRRRSGPRLGGTAGAAPILLLVGLVTAGCSTKHRFSWPGLRSSSTGNVEAPPAEPMDRSAFVGGAAEVSGDDFEKGVEGMFGLPFPGMAGGTVLQTSLRYLPRSNEISKKTLVALIVEARHDVLRGASPLRAFVGVGTGMARETSRLSHSEYGVPGSDSDDAVSGPLFRLSTGVSYAVARSRWIPFADIGYEIFTPRELHNKTVVRAGVRFLLSPGGSSGASGTR